MRRRKHQAPPAPPAAPATIPPKKRGCVGCLFRSAAFAVLIVVIGAVGAAMLTGNDGAGPAEQPARENSAGALTLDYLGPGDRFDPYAGFVVRLANGTDKDATNPQTQVVAEVGGRENACQGYVDAATGEAVAGVGDVLMEPLVVPAGETREVTILCRMLDVPLGGALLRLR